MDSVAYGMLADAGASSGMKCCGPPMLVGIV